MEFLTIAFNTSLIKKENENETFLWAFYKTFMLVERLCKNLCLVQIKKDPHQFIAAEYLIKMKTYKQNNNTY